jgi:hypothetical protein
MSQAFVKDEDAQWLHDVAPTLNALKAYLTRENNNIKVYDKESFIKDGVEIFVMSNGLNYSIGEDGKWQLVD